MGGCNNPCYIHHVTGSSLSAAWLTGVSLHALVTRLLRAKNGSSLSATGLTGVSLQKLRLFLTLYYLYI